MQINENDKSLVASVVIAAYNEQHGLPVVLTNLLKIIDSHFEIIVVDDGSTDKTAEVARAFPCRIIRHRFNRGKGAALRTGVTNANGQNIIFIDADGTYPEDYIPKIALRLGEYQLVMCSRCSGKRNIPLFNRAGNLMFRGILYYFFRFHGSDPFTGLYGIRTQIFKSMKLNSDRFGIEAEIAAKSSRMHLKMLEMQIAYNPRIGQTKLSSFKAGSEILTALLKVLFWKP